VVDVARQLDRALALCEATSQTQSEAGTRAPDRPASRAIRKVCSRVDHVVGCARRVRLAEFEVVQPGSPFDFPSEFQGCNVQAPSPTSCGPR
jgi:hypothetical protein